MYDVCYLVDAVRADQGLGAEPKKSVFPSVADAISAILDDEAGTAYTQWVTQNLTDEYRQAPPGRPMYSTLSTFSYKVPVYYNQQEFSHGFGQQVLDTLLMPVKDNCG